MQQSTKKLIRIKVRFANKFEKNKADGSVDFLIHRVHSRVYESMLSAKERLLYEATKNKVHENVVE